MSCNPVSRRGRSFTVPVLCVGLLLFAALISSCGGGSSHTSPPPPPPTNNSQGLVVDPGPTGTYVNGLFTTISICAPGTTTCEALNGVLVDTGSYGLRVLASGLSVSLSQQTNSNGTPMAECAQFADSVVWGPVATADIQIAGEKASSVPIQVIGASNYPDTTIPGICSSSGLPPADTLVALGANAILGVGVFQEDCGGACTVTGSSNPGVYFACPSPSTCAVAAEPLAAQLQNPVGLFTTDNNGLSITMPSVPVGGAQTVTGTLVFGIGTQSDNGLGNAKIYMTDSQGNFTTEYKSHSYTGFLDSGSGAMFFLDSATTGLTECTGTNAGLYCPSASVTQSATNIGTNSQSGSISFTISDAARLFATTNSAFIDLAGTNPNQVDWGMNFFYGRTVFVAIENQSTPGGMGPYWAY